MKDYIRDDGVIRNCNSNVAKMNIFEYWWFDIVHRKILKYAVLDTLEQYVKALQGLALALINTICIIFFPISILVKAFGDIKEAKRQVEKHDRIYGRK